jgi:hypothetical protein
VPVLYEPISIAKGVRCVTADALHCIALVKPNRFEVRAIAGAVRVAMGLPETDSAAEAAEDDDAADSVPSTVGRPGDRGPGAAGKRSEGGGRSAPSQATIKHTFVADPAGSGKLLPAETAATVVDAGGRVRSRRTIVSAGLSAAAGSSAAAAAAAGGSAAAVGSWATLAGSLLGPSQASLAPAATAAPPAALSEGADAARDSGEVEAESVVDYGLLTAAQTLLSAMVRPGPIAEAPRAPGQSLTPVVAAATGGGAVAALHVHGRALQVEQQIREMEAADAAAAAAAGAGGNAAVAGGSAAASAAAPATVEGRKHVLVTVGAEGVLWLSAPPAASHHTADLLASLPFFAAANHPALGLDFKLLPAPAVQRVAKVTGAGDTFAGAVVASLARGCTMAQSLRHALAAAKIAIETEPGAAAAPSDGPAISRAQGGFAAAAAATSAASSTISPRLTWEAVCAEAQAHVAPVEEGYD